MSVNNNSQSWNSKKFIKLSENLGEGYNLGLNNAKSDKKADSWNASKFIEMSRSLSSAYGVDF
ncbi:MAG: hypothetical protein AAGE84_10170 [Cyanobacteria bacterium P01_G01_bin.39]